MSRDYFDGRFLANGRERYEAGHKSELLYCLHYCVVNGVPIPDWLKQAFERAYDDVHTYKVKSWDDVFGRPLKKGRQLKTERRKLEIAGPIWSRVHELHRAGRGRPIDKALFDRVGNEFGISGTVAAELYYAIIHEHVEGDDDRTFKIKRKSK